MRRFLEVFGFLCFAIWAQAATVEQSDGYVVIRPDGGEARDGKSFAPYRVPNREIGVDIDRVNS